VVNTEKETPSIISATVGWQMMAMLVFEFDTTLSSMLDCLKKTSGNLSAKFEQDDCPDLSEAAEIRDEFSRSRTGETVASLIPRVEALSTEVSHFLDGKLAVFEQEILTYGEGPAARTLMNARHRLQCVKNALEELTQAIVHQGNAIVLLRKANKLPMDGQFLRANSGSE